MITTKKAKSGTNEYFTTPLSRILIKKIDLSDPKEKTKHDRITELVIELISLLQEKNQLESNQNDSKKWVGNYIEYTRIIEKINEVELRINQEIYSLFSELTQNDIRIIEAD